MRALVYRESSRSRFDFENCLVLAIGWVVALAVTWT